MFERFEEVTFRPRNGVAIATTDMRTTVLGAELAFPAIVAPVGFTRLFHPEGERAVALAAAAAGLPYCLSSFSGYHVNELRKVSSGALWYQLYLAGGRDVAEASLERAQKAGFTVLAVTIDTNVPGYRERDARNGNAQLMSASFFEKIPHLPQLLKRPGWLAGFLMDREALKFPNIVINNAPMRADDVHKVLSQSVMCWDDMKWIRQAWRGPIVMKGVSTGDDAKRSLDEGAAGVIVSNHGGRQLDGSPASLRVLPEVLEAVNGRGTVLMDGGIRRGGDIVKSICLGAKAVLVGRAYAYGLAAAGQAGVARALEILRTDVDRTLKLLGCGSIAELDQSFIRTK